MGLSSHGPAHLLSDLTARWLGVWVNTSAHGGDEGWLGGWHEGRGRDSEGQKGEGLLLGIRKNKGVSILDLLIDRIRSIVLASFNSAQAFPRSATLRRTKDIIVKGRTILVSGADCENVKSSGSMQICSPVELRRNDLGTTSVRFRTYSISVTHLRAKEGF